MTSAAVQQAVTLLRERRIQAKREIESLTNEVDEIEAALRSLGALEASPTAARVADPAAAVPRTALSSKTVRGAVLELLQSSPQALSVAQIVGALGPEMKQTRSDDQFRSTVRTALWTLRNDKWIDNPSRGLHRASKWATNDARDPAATGSLVAGSLVGSTPMNGAAGGESDAHPTPHDHQPARRDVDRNLGASVAEAAG
jgi:hypothetical protein